MAYTTIDNPELYFQIKLYTGDASSTSHTLDGDENMQPDLAWFKSRSRNDNHRIVDALRGTNSLKSNTTSAQVDSGSDGFTSLDADGFTLNGDGGGGEFNADSGTYVTWCWKESATAGFDIVDYDGAGAANHSHSLSAVPKFMIVKRYNATESWFVYNGGLGQAKVGYLNDTVAWGSGTNVWGGSDPTSSVFSIGSDSGISGSGDYIAYLWAEKQGFSKFSIFTGNGNADGTFVYTGFRPAFIMIKRTDSTGDWGIFDNKREGYNDETNRLKPNGNDAEEDDNFMDILSNGFKLRLTSSSINASGGTFIYAAFAEAPLVNSNGVPCNAR
jgi:hypothetical protein